MWNGALILSLVCVCAALAHARHPPHYDTVRQYFTGNTSAPGRYSNNLLVDASLDVPALIRKYRYPAEIHEVVTEDGYILEVHRIPHGRDLNNQPDPSKPVVLIMPGLFASSADWVLMGPGTALAYALAEAGFDVWLGNPRGTFYSQRHVSLDPDKDHSYWQYSWEEFGRFDIPAMIDHALAATNKSRLHYIGHSQGTTAFWVMGSLRPEYNSKIITMQAFAPVAYLQYNKNPVFIAIAPFANNIEVITRLLGIGPLLDRPAAIKWLGRLFCRDGVPTQSICTSLLFLISGYSEDQHNATMLPVKLAHTPAGASIRQLAHFGQHIQQDFFRRYDHGLMDNWQKYRSFTPPRFELEKVTAPVFLHYVDVDVFVDLKDLDRLWRELGNPMAKIKVPYEPFSHLDFMWGQFAKGVLYDRTINIMLTFPNN